MLVLHGPHLQLGVFGHSWGWRGRRSVKAALHDGITWPVPRASQLTLGVGQTPVSRKCPQEINTAGKVEQVALSPECALRKPPTPTLYIRLSGSSCPSWFPADSLHQDIGKLRDKLKTNAWQDRNDGLFFFFPSVFFINIFIDYAITVIPFPPLTPLHPAHPLPPTFPPIVHVHGSYL